MPVIKVLGLSARSEGDLGLLRQEIVYSVLAIPELGLHHEQQVSCYFLPDQMQCRPDQEVIVEVIGLFEKPERTLEIRNQLARNIGKVLQKHRPGMLTEVYIHPFNQHVSGFWRNR